MIHFEKWKVTLILGICVLGLALAVPNFFSSKTVSSFPAWLPSKQVNLGLDLRGGSHLLLEVQSGYVLKEYMESIVEGARSELRQAKIKYRNLGVDGDATDISSLHVGVDIIDADKVDEARKLLREIEPGSIIDSNDIANGGVRYTITLNEQAARERQNSAIQQSIEIVRRRIDETGVREPTIQRQGENRILVQLPGLDDPEQVKRLLGKTAKMTFHLVDTENSVESAIAGRIPPGSMLLPDHEIDSPQMYLIRKRVMVSGENLVDASSQTDQQTGQPVVSIRFDTRGAKLFGKATTENVNKPFAIILDGKVISAPRINEPILGGVAQISGNFTFQSAQELALLLRAGALPAPLIILEERSVGPGLGADSIAAGKLASIVGMVGVVVFMFIAYGFFGLMANVALIINIFLILGALSVLQATLTLPGIAGIVLTIGMAVDANVLVFERIREEVRNGRTPMSAMDAGYTKAFTTIIDANVTTLIAAVLLYIFGSGPIRGFAVTLTIGIITSLFTTIMLVRLMAVTWLHAKRPKTLPL